MKKDVIVKNNYDVIVVGGGVAGVAAAVASARNGVKTLLMEKTVTLGGLGTQGLISWYEPLCNGEGKQLIAGIPEELIKLCVKYGFENMPTKWGGKGVKPLDQPRYVTRYSPYIFALALIEYLEENNVDLIFDTLATYPKMENNLCVGIEVETLSGREFYPAKMVVDASGTAVICERAGIPTEVGENYLSYVTHEMDFNVANELAKTGDFCASRKWRGAGSSLDGVGHPENMKTLHGVTAEDVTFYMTTGGKMVMERIKKQDKNSFDILSAPTMPQFRKIRRIVGDSEFMGTEDNIVPENSVGSFGDFRNPGRHFHLPYTTLFNSKFPNIFAAGRIISAKDEGWEITRVIPVAAMSGEAAGTAAALCVKEEVNACNLDVDLLQTTLKSAGVLFK
ncbi:MAG: FAD-dependent oxidoreductase [Ruminococcaceae bacterium]|nr:FAD-dependent oxidoreductase [Oscillospiraceae bacterium]